ncbi:hypothetical protein DH2020_012877 [Rehmannia glutinosa]|uniref:DUF4283 domain-containing protein n=1 Tax=Rehmannia glutinosa TaxID=99300 RepID=A0ABR0X0L4_REHGL
MDGYSLVVGDRRRVFKWTPSFNPKMEAPLAPVWIRLLGLPIHFFDHNALLAIGNIIGTPLQVESLTATRSRLSMARVCVELDLLKERIEEIVLEFDDTSHAQKIIYERIPDYCTHCKHIGHSIEGCYMNGKISRPPPPVRRPTPITGSDGYDLNGLNRKMKKSRGTTDNSKISRAENPNPTRGAQRTVAQNQDWIQVKKKGPRETGLVSKEFLKSAKKSKHTYFEDSHSNAESSGINRFSSLENDVFQPLDTLSQLIKGPDQGNDLNLDDQINPITGGKNLVGDVAVARNEDMASSAGVSTGDNCGTISINIPPAFSKPAAHLEDFSDQLDNGNLLGPTSTPFHATKVVEDKHNFSSSPSCAAAIHGVGPGAFLSSLTYSTNKPSLAPPYHPSFAPSVHVLPLHDHLGIDYSLNGISKGPTPMSLIAQKVDDSLQHTFMLENALHTLEFVTKNNNGPYPLFSTCDAVSNAVDPGVCLSPLHIPANNFNLDPPHHFHSAAANTPGPDDASRAVLG